MRRLKEWLPLVIGLGFIVAWTLVFSWINDHIAERCRQKGGIVVRGMQGVSCIERAP